MVLLTRFRRLVGDLVAGASVSSSSSGRGISVVVVVLTRTRWLLDDPVVALLVGFVLALTLVFTGSACRLNLGTKTLLLMC